MVTLVFIPGTLCNADLFDAQLSFFEKEFCCVVADHSTSNDLETLSQRILNGVRGDILVIGLSYGGIIAMEMMRQASERIVGLVLMNTTYKQPSVRTREAQERFVGMAYMGKFEEITKDFLKDYMLHPEKQKDQSLRQRILKMAVLTGKENFFNQIQAQLGRPDSRLDLETYTCPVLLIAGNEDLACPPSLHEEMSDLIPNSDLFVLKDCGHLSPMERPNEVNQILNDWFDHHFCSYKKRIPCEKIM